MPNAVCKVLNFEKNSLRNAGYVTCQLEGNTRKTAEKEGGKHTNLLPHTDNPTFRLFTEIRRETASLILYISSNRLKSSA